MYQGDEASSWTMAQKTEPLAGHIPKQNNSGKLGLYLERGVNLSFIFQVYVVVREKTYMGILMAYYWLLLLGGRVFPGHVGV